MHVSERNDLPEVVLSFTLLCDSVCLVLSARQQANGASFGDFFYLFSGCESYPFDNPICSTCDASQLEMLAGSQVRVCFLSVN